MFLEGSLGRLPLSRIRFTEVVFIVLKVTHLLSCDILQCTFKHFLYRQLGYLFNSEATGEPVLCGLGGIRGLCIK